MQITVLNVDGLQHEFNFLAPAALVEERLVSQLEKAASEVKMPGFRPGKVPLKLLRQKYGERLHEDAKEALIEEGIQKIIAEHGLRPALAPKIEVAADYKQGSDLTVNVKIENLPQIDPCDITKLEFTRMKCEVSDAEIEKSIRRIAQDQRTLNPPAEARKSQNGDVVVIDFVGKRNGVPFEHGTGTDYELELGSGTFIPGFEEQLQGADVGEHRDIKVTFPETYGNKELAGQEAEFAVDVKKILVPEQPPLDDALAEKLGFSDLEALKKVLHGHFEREYSGMARLHLKRAILDTLAAAHEFPVPPTLLEMEFAGIWRQVQEDREKGRLDEEDKNKSEAELEADYKNIALRRVRLGLLLSEIGNRNNIQVSENDLRNALQAEAGRYPGQEHLIYQYYSQNREALMNLRAPIFEEKTIDFIAEMAKVTEIPASLEDLMRDPDAAPKAA